MREIALDVTLSIVFGATGTERARELRAVLPRVPDAPRLPMLWKPARQLPYWREYETIHARARTLIEAEIVDRRGADNLDQRTDILSSLIRDPDAKHTDAELVDLLMLLLVAGHESTATGMSWVFERLVRHPEAMAALRTELASGDADRAAALLDATVRETLRVRPITYVTSRKAVRPVRVGEYTIPAGVVVMAAGGLVQKSPNWFDEPELFRPERFLTERVDQHAWIPFGGGTRRCLGANLALAEAATVLRAVLESAEIGPAELEPEPCQPRNVTLTPAKGARVVIQRKLTASVHSGETAVAR